MENKMKHDPIYKPAEALTLMGLLCAKSSCDTYILNMKRAGLLATSYKLGNRWHITEKDIIFAREKIMNGQYKPSSRLIKNAA